MTMSYEPPSGAEDLAAQTAEIERQREELIQEMALVRQRRAERPPVADQEVGKGAFLAEALAAEYHDQDPLADLAKRGTVGAVIDPDGLEYETDADGAVLRDGQDQPIPTGDYDRDENGVALLDESGTPIPAWPHDTIEFRGRKIQIRLATPEALNAFSMSASDSLPQETQNRIYHKFVDAHISMRSRVELIDAMIDGSFSMDDYRELFKRIARNGSARPTKPSKR
ncbi:MULTISPECIES: hypothetical protein [Nocardia]|uniref:hypothetical protein n=1 Tax=Nocardia TaxID=1817 RepID=UPI0024558198|nr:MULTISPECIES: hypothetical protein [Nocardia]